MPESDADDNGIGFYQPSDFDELNSMMQEWEAMDSLAALSSEEPTLPEGFEGIPGVDWSFLE